jgi:hypothetical protein
VKSREIQEGKSARFQWFTPVILVTWVSLVRWIAVESQPEQKFSETPSQPIAREVAHTSHAKLCGKLHQEVSISKSAYKKACKTPSEGTKTA